MTLSDSKVQRSLQKNFVCVWENTEGDPVAGASFAHDPSDAPPTCIRGNGEHNLQLLMLTPEGQILNATSGFLSPEELLEELELALTIAGSLTKTEGSQQKRVVVQAQQTFLEQLEQREFPGPLGDFERRRVLKDHNFVVEHPLLPAASYRAEMQVGNSKTFFGSSVGEPPEERIGEGPDDPFEKPPKTGKRR